MQVMIRYQLRPDEVPHCLGLMRGVYAEFAATRPDWLRQATFQLEDQVSFVTFVELDDPARLGTMPEFQRYRQAINECCTQPPAMTVLTEIGSYRFG